MKLITAELCWKHFVFLTEERLAELFPRPTTPMEVLTRQDGVYATLSPVRRIDVVLVHGVLPDRMHGFFVCNCAARALSRVTNPDPRAVHAVEVGRLFWKGVTTRDDLRQARVDAVTAASDIVGTSAYFANAAAFYAACLETCRTYSVANHAAHFAAKAAPDYADERAAQVADLIRLIEENE